MKKINFLTVCVVAAQMYPLFAKAETAAKQYQIIDGTAEIAGSPDPLTTNARKKWSTACDDWKKELKELNGTQLIALSCNTPKCEAVGGVSSQCVSQGSYKVKIDGAIIPPAPEVENKPEVSQPVVVQTAPPAEVVEVVPEPRPGFIWVAGYWGWVGHRHIWYPGHWMTDRPGYVWVGHSWVHRGDDWEFRFGHWGRR